MMRCDGCKHWGAGPEDDWEVEDAGFKRCHAVRPRWLVADQGGERAQMPIEDGDYQKWVDARNNAVKAARAFVMDGSEYRAELYTGPDFFCALHESTL